MASRYYVNKNAQNNGDHEVHKTGCPHLEKMKDENKKYLGDFDSCYPAVVEAKKTYVTADGCATCCPNCHTS